MQLFYAPDIETSNTLPEGESQHCVKVLRLNVGEIINITDGKGKLFKAEITNPHSKHCEINILESKEFPSTWGCHIEIAIAPTKNIDRIEWFTEKCVEMGIDTITPINCRYSERKEIKADRIEKVIVSAMKQSLKFTKPSLSPMVKFKDFVKQPFDGDKFIAHCHEEKKVLLRDAYKKGNNCLILIGPEGDFSEEEVSLAIENGFKPISLGESRLRTETAGMVACSTIQIINQ